MTVLVTGGKGFIGAAVVRRLLAYGQEVVVLEPRPTPGRLAEVADRVRILPGDVTDLGSLLAAMQEHGVERVAHLVLYRSGPAGDRPGPGGPGPEDLYNEITVMMQGTANVFEAARRAGVRRIVFPSSIAYYGAQWRFGERPLREEDPSLTPSLYGVYKHLGEVLAHQYNRRCGMEIVSLRVPIVYGPGGRIAGGGVNLIATEGALGRPVVLPGAPEDRVLIAHVEDVAEIVARLLLAERVRHEVYNVGGHTVSYQELADILRELLPDAQVSFQPQPGIELPYLVDWGRLREELGFQHRDIRQAYREFIDQTRRQAGLPPLAAS